MPAAKPEAVPFILKAATLSELVDAIVLPARGREVLFVLAGFGNALRNHYSLAEPVNFSTRVKVSAGVREYDVQLQDFRTFPEKGNVVIDLRDAALYRLDTAEHDHFRIMLVCREERFAQDFEKNFGAIAADAVELAKDWRLENALEWCVAARRANAGELQPVTGIKLPDKLLWRLRKPVFRVDEHRVLYQWELCSIIDGPHERPMITCVTDNTGAPSRNAELLPIKLMFSRLPTALRPAPAGAAAPAPAVAAPASAAAPAEKVVPDFRKKALEERMRIAGETEMAKIRKLFEMPD